MLARLSAENRSEKFKPSRLAEQTKNYRGSPRLLNTSAPTA
jgi:hypothetical protein